jgi:glycopeptide antibiotics resistance protein
LIVETDYRWKEDEHLNESMKNVIGFEETSKEQMWYAEYLAKILSNLTLWVPVYFIKYTFLEVVGREFCSLLDETSH